MERSVNFVQCHSIYLDPIIKKVFIFDTKGLSVVLFLVTHTWTKGF
jgi:hypothetical protein